MEIDAKLAAPLDPNEEQLHRLGMEQGNLVAPLDPTEEQLHRLGTEQGKLVTPLNPTEEQLRAWASPRHEDRTKLSKKNR